MMIGNPFLTINKARLGYPGFFHIFVIKGIKGRFRGFCTGLPHSLHRNPFPTISLGFFHHLPTTKNPSTLSTNGYRKGY